MTVSFSLSVTVTVKIWLGAIGVMIKGPSDEEAVGAGGAGAEGASLGGAGAPVGGAGASVGEGSTFVIAYDVLEEAGSLKAGTADDVAALDEGVGVASALVKGTEEEAGVVDAADEVAFAGAEGATEDSATCEDDNEAEETADVSAGAVADGNTVVYCVMITTGGTCREVDGRSSTDADESMVEVAEIAAPVELELATEGAGAVTIALDDNAMLAEDRPSDAAAVGKTVVYSVFVTTRPDEMVMVEFAGARSAELEVRTEDAAGLTGGDELGAEELTNALLTVAGS